MDGSDDVHQTVEYRRDKWTMRRVPLALLLCLAGMALLIHVAPGLPDPRILAIFTAILAAWVIGRLLFVQVFDGSTTERRWLAVGLAILATVVLLALVTIARAWKVPGDILDYRGRPHPPANIGGWMIFVGSVGWIAWALYRHFVPARPPLLALSPAGISYAVAGLRDVLIRWHEVQGVDGFEVIGPSGFPLRNEDITVVLVAPDLYEQRILPQRTFMTPPGWEQLFVPKGASVQVMLAPEWFAIEPTQIRGPVEARWKAFRDAPPAAVPNVGPIPRAHQVYGAWSIDGSLWQAVAFLVPLAGIVALLASAPGGWPR